MFFYINGYTGFIESLFDEAEACSLAERYPGDNVFEAELVSPQSDQELMASALPVNLDIPPCLPCSDGHHLVCDLAIYDVSANKFWRCNCLAMKHRARRENKD